MRPGSSSGVAQASSAVVASPRATVDMTSSGSRRTETVDVTRVASEDDGGDGEVAEGVARRPGAATTAPATSESVTGSIRTSGERRAGAGAAGPPRGDAEDREVGRDDPA